MIQGMSKNVDSFITDYVEQLIPSQRNFNIEQLSKEEIIIKTLNDTKDKRCNDDKANEAGKLKENTIDLTESEAAQNSDSNLSLKDENDLPDDPNDTEITNYKDLEGKPLEEIALIINNQRDIFKEMNKYNESQINNLFEENKAIWGALNKQLEFNEDMEIRFQSKLKFQQHYFERMIEDQNNSFKLQLNKINEELKQAKNTIADLKGQLKVAQKDNKSKDPQSHNIKIASTQTIANEKLAKVPTHSLITDPVNTQSADTKDISSMEIPKSPVVPKNNNIYTHLYNIPEDINSSDLLPKPQRSKSKEQLQNENASSTSFVQPHKKFQNFSNAANNYTEEQEPRQQHFPPSTSHNPNLSQHNKSFNTKSPILILGDSMIKGIKEHVLDRQTFIKKICITGAVIKDFIQIITDMDDTTPYSKILIHLGTNDIRNDDENTIIKNLQYLISIIRSKWENSTIIFSGIILHKTDSRKNTKINSLNDTIKQEAQNLNIEFLDNVNIVTLPSGHIDPDAYYGGSLHLSNEKGYKKFANNIKIQLKLKSTKTERSKLLRNRKPLPQMNKMDFTKTGYQYMPTPLMPNNNPENQDYPQYRNIPPYHVNEESRDAHFSNHMSQLQNSCNGVYYYPDYRPQLIQPKYFKPHTRSHDFKFLQNYEPYRLSSLV